MKLTLQKIFDNAWQAFIVDKKPPGAQLAISRDDDHELSVSFHCQYLTDLGDRCAIGYSLPDDIAAKFSGDDSAPFSTVVTEHPELFSDDILNGSPSNLARFQNMLHDRWVDEDTGMWYRRANLEREYREVAVHFGLLIPGDDNGQA